MALFVRRFMWTLRLAPRKRFFEGLLLLSIYLPLITKRARAVGRAGGRGRSVVVERTDCFSSDLTSFLPPCRLALKLSIVLIISFLRPSRDEG